MQNAIRRSDGQATVEFVALLPIMAAVALLAWQIAVAGEAMWMAAGAARAAARAQALGRNVEGAAAAALTPRLRADLRVRTTASSGVDVSVGIPSVVGGGRLSTVHAQARFTPQGR